ncbi:MAG: potassium channel family protein [Phycisphaerae bacterium]|nr:potassium channel family protein [Phycisphaerae bacterium]
MTQIRQDASPQIFRELVRGKYFWLLLSLLLMVLFAPVLVGFAYGVYVVDFINVLVLVTAVYAISHSHHHVIFALVLVVPAAALKVLVALIQAPHAALVVPLHVLLVAFLVYLMVIILADVLSHRRVTADTIKGAVCVYLLMGLAWAMAFSLAAYLDPHAFRIHPTIGVSAAEMTFHSGGFGYMVYFSLVTLTTLGYGDITPLIPIIRSLAAMEAVVGQVFLTVLVARLVGMHLYTISETGD